MAQALEALGAKHATRLGAPPVKVPHEEEAPSETAVEAPPAAPKEDETGLGVTLQPAEAPAGETEAAADDAIAPVGETEAAGDDAVTPVGETVVAGDEAVTPVGETVVAGEEPEKAPPPKPKAEPMAMGEKRAPLKIPTAVWIGGGALAVVALAVGGFFAFRGAGPASPQSTATSPAPVEQATSPAEPTGPSADSAWPGVVDEMPSERVAAFYYPWYGNPDVDGTWFHWQDAGRDPPFEVTSSFYPLLGPYSSNDPAVVAQHFAWLREAGVGVVITSWWGPGDRTDQVVPMLLEVADHYGLKVAFQIEPYDERSAASLVEHIRYIVDSYGGSPAFFRTPDPSLWSQSPEPRGLFFLFDPSFQPGSPEGGNSAYWAEPLDVIHEGHLGLVVAGTSDVGWIQTGHFDGLYNYFTREADGQQAFAWAGELPPGAWYVPSVSPGYQSREAGQSGATSMPRNGGATYDSQWDGALAQGVHPKLVTITSFNQWHDGTMIEPATTDDRPGGAYAYNDFAGLGPLGYLERTKVWVNRLGRWLTGEPFECDDPIGCVTYGPGEPIELASALVVSGPNADLGIDSMRGVDIAIRFWGPIEGHEVTLRVEDDRCSYDGGQAAGKRIASDPAILGVVGTSCSGAAVPMSSIISDAGYFMVSPSNTSPVLTDPEQAWHPGYFRTAHNDKVQGPAMAEFAYSVLGLRSAAGIHDGDPYTEELANSFLNAFVALGGRVTFTGSITPGAADMHHVLEAAATSGPPDFLYFPVFTEECTRLAQQSRDVPGLANTVLAAADGCISSAAASALGSVGQGMFFSGPDLSFGGDQYAEFLATYRELYGTDPISVFHAHAFDATNMILTCVEQVSFVDVDRTLHIGRQAMRNCLQSTSNFEGITGSLTCDEHGDCADPRISVSELQNGNYQRIWP
jgi:branched-chain amino acid transport system substrate-binding protein